MRKFHIVIIGAATSGLYLANKFVEAGIPINEILVCDPRAGQYTRPGDIDFSSFNYLTLASGPLFIKTPGKSYHIKEIERALYQLALDKSILIENSTFVGFIDEPGKTGVIVKPNHGETEIIECDYLFDCTGFKRTVVKAVNTRFASTTSPFNLLPVASYTPISHYVLAYLEMTAPDLAQINASSGPLSQQELLKQTPLEFSQHIKKLQALGWDKEFYPQCRANSFGDHKACLYIEAPTRLSPEDLINWVKTVVHAITNNPNIAIKQVKASVKYGDKKDKLRLMHFNVDLNYLDPVIFQHPGIPIVIPLGDAAHASLLWLGNGVAIAAQLIDALLKNLLITDGAITHFDQEQYKQRSGYLLAIQRDKQFAYLEARTLYFYNSLAKVSLFYQQAIEAADTEITRSELQEKLGQIQQLRLIYDEALQSFPEKLAQLKPSFAAEIEMLKKALDFEDLPKGETLHQQPTNISSSSQPQTAFESVDIIFAALKLPVNKHNPVFIASLLGTYQLLPLTAKRSYFDNYLECVAEILSTGADSTEINPTKKNILSITLSSVIQEFDQEYKKNKLFFTLGLLIDPTLVSVCRLILHYRALLIAQPLNSLLGDALQILPLIEQELTANDEPSTPTTTKLGFFVKPQIAAEANPNLQTSVNPLPPPGFKINLI